MKRAPSSLDYFELTGKARTLNAAGCGESFRLAILGDAATQQLATLLRVLSAKQGIRLEVFEGPFDGIEIQVYDPDSDLYRFSPDAILILNVAQALRNRYYRRSGSGQEFLEAEWGRIQAIWTEIRKHCSAQVIQSNFVLPLERLFGNFDHKVADSLYSVTAALNFRIAEESRTRSYVFVNDVEGVASYVGRRTWFDNRFWNISKVPCTLEHLPRVADNVVDMVLSIRGRGVKAVVLDLDNTLWGGVIGDDGVHGISLSAHGDGESFYEFQCFLRELQRRGILLTVCSKNNIENAVKPFREHPEMVLREEDISVFVANWEDKASNIRHIREKLNIGLDSMVFLDDNPFERNLVRSLAPEVMVPELPEEPSDYVSALNELNLFESSSYSEEDRQRTALYRQRAEREEAQNSFGSLEDYLRSLDTEITVSRFTTTRIPRISQLTQRSNQFNLTTRRRSESDCEELMADERTYPIYAELRDRLGDHGLVSVVVAIERAQELHISDWLMSCRVLKRGVEQFLMNHLVEMAARNGYRSITAEYRPSAKNSMVANFYAEFGFEKTDEKDAGVTQWRLDVPAYQPRTVYMRTAELAYAETGKS